MADLNSPAELQKQAMALVAIIHTLMGVFIWEWFISLDFDWAYISGKKKFRWPMLFYFLNRYVLMAAFISVLVTFDSTTEINCSVSLIFNQLTGDATVGFASINLALRTMAIWGDNRYVIGLLVLIILGHWSLILQAVNIEAMWVEGMGCVITRSDNTILSAIFIYAMGFDLIILLLNTYKLLGLDIDHSTMGTWRNNRLTRLIFEDGLIYFMIAFCANLVATVFMLTKPSEILSIMFNFPAAIVSSMAAMRVVRRLSNYSNAGPAAVYPSARSTSLNQTGGLNPSKFGTPAMSAVKSNGVHVQMETFTRAEDADQDVYNSNNDIEKGRF